MLFKFKSQATADLIMLEADARRLLHIMLGEDPVKGILQAQNLPAAITALEAAVLQDQAQHAERMKKEPKDLAAEQGERQAPNAVSLAQRAAPMIKLLKRCVAEDCDVVWGV